jgi:hypothetical protein
VARCGAANNNNNDDDDNRSADRLLRLFQKNKGIYVKAGQHISSLDYILPYVLLTPPRPSYYPFHSVITTIVTTIVIVVVIIIIDSVSLS